MNKEIKKMSQQLCSAISIQQKKTLRERISDSPTRAHPFYIPQKHKYLSIYNVHKAIDFYYIRKRKESKQTFTFLLQIHFSSLCFAFFVVIFFSCAFKIPFSLIALTLITSA